MKIGPAVVPVVAIAALTLSLPAQAQVQKWVAHANLESGQNTVCLNGGTRYITEGNGKFSISYTKDGPSGDWPQNPDGSVKADVRIVVAGQSARTYRLEVPAGKGPRGFTNTDLTMVCRYQYKPM